MCSTEVAGETTREIMDDTCQGTQERGGGG